MTTSSPRFARRFWLRHLGRVLAIVTQLVLLCAPLAEGREERLLDPHVEAPMTRVHPGHQVSTCAECVLLTVHGRTEERSRLRELPQSQSACAVERSVSLSAVARAPSNSSRAPPSCL